MYAADAQEGEKHRDSQVTEWTEIGTTSPLSEMDTMREAREVHAWDKPAEMP